VALTEGGVTEGGVRGERRKWPALFVGREMNIPDLGDRGKTGFDKVARQSSGERFLLFRAKFECGQGVTLRGC